MRITQSFHVARPLPDVWILFQDMPLVATCMPGAELTEDKGNGVYAGRVGIRLGPFNASFEGEATVARDEAAHSGRVEGRGVDKRGGSRSKLLLDYRLTEDNGATRVDIDSDLQLSGPIAQFGRTGIITETATILIEQFARNVEQKLAALPPRDAPVNGAHARAMVAEKSKPISVFGLLLRLLGSLFRRKPA
jgi:carbon monoxide dehydrogenase subunit G